ncbi:PilN domain-containing protein [Crenothrix sp.]|uniref:PilN domain-containing protein n=1 Tax=Crenothrix sp. TaxID=3100433 RepID=UPI00374DDA97
MNLNSTIDLDVKKLWHWWVGELSFLVPEKVKQLVTDKRGTVIVHPDGNQFVLSFVDDQHSEQLARLDRNETGIAQYKELLATDERLDKAQLIIRLSERDAIQKELSLPAAAKENLQQVVAYELDRYTPFKAEQIYFAVQPLEVENEPGQLRVMLIIALKETVDAIYEDAKNMGMVPLFVDYEDAANNLLRRNHYNLLPENLRPKTANLPRLVHGGLIGLFAVLGAMALAMPVWFEYREVNALQSRVDGIEKEAKKVNVLQADIEAMMDETRQLLAEKSATPAVVVILDALSSLIKDNTWLAYAQYSEKQLQMQGESPNASTLISVLEASDIFTNARFVSPVTQDTVSKLERFQITVDATKAGGIDGTGKK